MKKTESHKTTFVASGHPQGGACPVAPVRLGNPSAQQRGADPSSCFRSSRYPVPQVEYRTAAAR